MPVRVRYVEITEVLDEDGNVLNKTKVKLKSLPAAMRGAVQATPGQPSPATAAPLAQPGGLRPADEPLPVVADRPGRPSYTDEQRRDHIRRVNAGIRQVQAVANVNPIPLVETDAELLALTGMPAKFVSPVPVPAMDNGQVVVHQQPSGAGPRAIGSGGMEGMTPETLAALQQEAAAQDDALGFFDTEFSVDDAADYSGEAVRAA